LGRREKRKARKAGRVTRANRRVRPSAPPPAAALRERRPLLGKTAQALLWFLLFCLLAGLKSDPREVMASLSFGGNQSASWFSTAGAAVDSAAEPMTETPAPTPEPDAGELAAQAAASLGLDFCAADLTGPFRRIEDPTGRAMSSFYEALTRTARKEQNAITRILHFGDSLVVVDFLTGEARRRLQSRFGDAGHGYMLAGRPWPWYQHWDVTYSTSREWRVDGVMNPKSKAGHYGLAGYAFDGSGPGQFVEWGTSASGEIGRKVGHFELHYLIQPGGGSLLVFVDGQLHGKVRTAGPGAKSGVYAVDVKDGPHKFRAQCAGDGPVRVFGGVLERGGPGVVYDTLGINGGRARTLDRINPELWAEQLKLRRPDLILFNFGTNESEDADRPMATVEADYLSVLRRARAAAPAASCLVVSPPDRAARQGGQLTTHPMIPRLVATQRRAALAAGCAFYDTYEAMGGRGSMAHWFQSRPPMCAGDMTHPNRRGADVLGDVLFRSLIAGLTEYTAAGLRLKPVAVASAPPAIKTLRPLLPDQPDPHPPLPERPRLFY
jgi:lysophospholipase L1-like esterase